MNEKAISTEQKTKLPTVTSNIGTMLFEPGVFERVTQMSQIMAKSKAMVPQYLRGNESDCMALIMQSAQWGMDPFAVAAKTYQIKPGAPIGYEAQLINSVIIINAPIVERPKYTFFGEWDRVQGKLKIMSGQNGKYAVPDWKPEDEEGLGVTVTLQVKGEAEPTSMDVLLKQCWPRNSTNWANDPQQQICYAAIRKMARRHFPDVIMGLYTPDELTHVQPEGERDITPTDNNVESLLESKPEPELATMEDRIKNFIKTIESAANLNRLKAIGNQIKSSEQEIQAAVREAYAAKLDELRPNKKEPQVDTETVSKEGETP